MLDRPMTYFSDAFLALAAPHAAWALERNDRFRRFLDGKWLKTEIPQGRIRLDDGTVPAGLLASYAEDFTLKWGWSFGHAPGDPEAVHAHRLHEIALAHDVPELTGELVDLSRFPDPRLASTRLSVVALGLLGAGGLLRSMSGGRAQQFFVCDDPGFDASDTDGPGGVPEPQHVAAWLGEGAALLKNEASASALVRGYAERHGLPVRETPCGLKLELPGGDSVSAEIDDADRLGDVVLHTVASRAPETRPLMSQVYELDSDVPHPVELLKRTAPSVLANLAARTAQCEAVEDAAARTGRGGSVRPYFDRESGKLRLGGVLDLAACETGGFDSSGTAFTWADHDEAGTEWFRSLAREHGAPHLAEDTVRFDADSPRWRWAAGFLQHAALPPDEARGVWKVPVPGGEVCVAVTDPAAPWMPSPRGLGEAVLAAASMVQPLVPRGHRYRVMRAMVYGFFARAGMARDHVGEPEVFIGRQGLHEFVVELAHDSTVNDVRVGRPSEWLARAADEGRI